MPGAKNPNASDFFVYVFHAKNYPFYVGHGRAGRLEDRPIYIDRLVRLHPDYSYPKWKRHMKVVADLWEAKKIEVNFDQITKDQTKAEAAKQEGELLQELLCAGFLMSNEAGNPGVRPPNEIVEAICAGTKQWDYLLNSNFKRVRVNHYVRPKR